MMRHLRAAKMFTLENEAVSAETQRSTERPWLGHYWSIQSSQSDAFLQTTIYSRRTNVTAAPPPTSRMPDGCIILFGKMSV